MGKSDFSLVKPPVAELKKEGYTISLCAPVGGGNLTYSVADIEAALLAAGIESPNITGNPPQIVGIYGTTAPKGRVTRDHVTDADVTANGGSVLYTDEVGIAQNVAAGERAGKEVCLLDEDCNLITDESVDDTNQWEIPEGSCMVFAIDVA